MLRFYPEKTKIIFFDLEFYVPKQDRSRTTRSGMLFSPLRSGHKVIGGTFLTYYPILDRIGKRTEIWEWNSGSENNALKDIFGLLEQEWKNIQTKDPHGSLMLCGVGISHSDIPTLLSRSSNLNFATPERIYDLVCGCRHIDLSTMTLSQFSSKHAYFAYPKSKASLYQKYLTRKPISSGTLVWDWYDDKEYGAIESRCREEVDDILSIYKSSCDLKTKHQGLLDRLKWFERNHGSKVRQ